LDRFCGAEGLKNVVNLSDFRGSFSDDYQLTITDGPLKGLASRVVIILDENAKILYTEQVPEIKEDKNIFYSARKGAEMRAYGRHS